MIQVAIDGPSGAGKSTIAKEVAKALGFTYLDTGAMYRALAVYLLDNAIDPDDEARVVAVLNQAKIAFVKDRILLNGEDVSTKIRQEHISQAASKVGKHADVRAHMVNLQQGLAKGDNVVMEGRDICVAVLPNAQFKYFVTADPKIRAERRYKEQISRGLKVDLEEILNDILLRDKRDTERVAVPLVKTDDAKLIDTSNKTIKEIVSDIKAQVERG